MATGNCLPTILKIIICVQKKKDTGLEQLEGE